MLLTLLPVLSLLSLAVPATASTKCETRYDEKPNAFVLKVASTNELPGLKLFDYFPPASDSADVEEVLEHEEWPAIRSLLGLRNEISEAKYIYKEVRGIPGVKKPNSLRFAIDTKLFIPLYSRG